MLPVLALPLLLLLLAAPQCHALEQQLELPNCSSEEQQVQCGQLPFDSLDAVAVYVQCCQLFEPKPLPAAAQAAAARAAAAQAATAASTPRPDLDLSATGRYATPPAYQWDSEAFYQGRPASTCVAKATVLVPAFLPQQVLYSSVTAPLLTSTQIQRVKARILAGAHRAVATSFRRLVLRLRMQVRRTAPAGTPFKHPAGLMGAMEIVLMQLRLTNRTRTQPQGGALDKMLSGEAVRCLAWLQFDNIPVAWTCISQLRRLCTGAACTLPPAWI